MEYTNSKIREIIGEYIHSQRDREILEKRFVDGLTFEQLAEHFSMSDRQIKRIVDKLQGQIFRHL